MALLHENARPGELHVMARFGIVADALRELGSDAVQSKMQEKIHQKGRYPPPILRKQLLFT